MFINRINYIIVRGNKLDNLPPFLCIIQNNDNSIHKRMQLFINVSYDVIT
jgi:hypothetical protein